MHVVEAKSLLTKWNAINIYRGCTHGCIYCDSRSACYHFDHAFEDVEVKQNAPVLLEQILKTKRKKIMISTGSMSDPYQPIEKKWQLTRTCLQLIDRYGFGATLITKSDLVLRDLDLLAHIHQRSKAVVQMSLTCASDTMSHILEPHVCTSRRRYEVLKACQARGIPTIVWLTPVLPYLTDTRQNLKQILDWCVDADVKGILFFHAGMTLRKGSRDYYYQMLDASFPGLRQRYEKVYGNAYEVMSQHNKEWMELFHSTCQAAGIMDDPEEIFRYTSTLDPSYEPLTLF